MKYEEKLKTLNNFVERGRGGEKLNGIHIDFFSAELMECLGISDLDFIVINQEHSTITDSRAVSDLVRIAEQYNKVAVVKLNSRDPIAARDALDCGSDAIIIPFCDSVEIFEGILQASLFHPRGNRSMCPISRVAGYGFNDTSEMYRQLLQFTNEHLLIIPNIESTEAVANIDEILAHEACRLISLGPFDLALSMGVNYSDPAGWETIFEVVSEVIGKCREAGVMTMIPWSAPPQQKTDFASTREAVLQTLERSGANMHYGAVTMLLGSALRAMLPEGVQFSTTAACG